ncbi:MAG: sulfatase [Myxococcales bacterium]|nr:sulfatase [Myxococcales bacterium]
MPTTWKNLVPPRHGWVRLFTSFSTYVLVASGLATCVGKALAVAEMDDIGHPLLLLAWALTSDGLVYFGAAALLALMESRLRRAWILTIPLALGGAITATLNTGYLIITGEQASWEAFTELFARFQDVTDITGEGVTTEVILRIIGGFLIGVGLPLILRWELRRRRWDFDRRVHGRARMLCAAWLAFAAFVVMLVTPRPESVKARNLGKNALLSTIRTAMAQMDRGSFKGYKPVRLVSSTTVDKVAERQGPPNVLVVVLESTRYDKTGLSGNEEVASTPNLEALAAEGMVAHRARAVLPHTTKSLFSILCGRFPTMQKKVVEVSSDVRIQCLPKILDEAGYATAFFQSSWGTFEWRPRLVHRLGFEHFEAFEDIRGQSLGYLASDDESLVRPFGKWLREVVGVEQRPFFATLLTSATHHPYRLSRKANKIAKKEKLPSKTNEERYLRLIEAEDRMLGGLLRELEKQGLRDNTYVVVLGDHGEGFGDKGVKQHDNNYYEEGLRVPLVIAGPKIEEHYEVPGNASLIDVTPTLLSLLDIPVDDAAKAELGGYDLLSPTFPGDQPRWFSCWFELRCRGFVVGDRKVVYEPQVDEAWYYDLKADPEENRPIALTRELEGYLKTLQTTLKAFRARKWKLKWGHVAYGEWICNKNDRYCRHPKAKKDKYRPKDADKDEAEGDKAKDAKDAKAEGAKGDKAKAKGDDGKKAVTGPKMKLDASDMAKAAKRGKTAAPGGKEEADVEVEAEATPPEVTQEFPGDPPLREPQSPSTKG